MKPKRNYRPGPMDECQTPGYVLEPLLKGLSIGLENKNINYKMYRVWEPASGDGILSRELEKFFGYVRSTCITTGTDFLDYPYDPDCDMILTNPPWKLKKEFTTKCLELGVPFALIYQTESMSQKWFIDLVEKYGEPGVIHFSPRVNFKMPEKGWKGTGAQMEASWFTWHFFTGNRFLRMDHWSKDYRSQFEV